MSIPAPFSASILIIGNEILSGQTADVNINFLARRLQSLGIVLKEVRIVPDIEDEIIAAVNALRHRYAHVFTTGGIGPTHDDITAAAVARAFDKALVCNKQAADRLFLRYPDHSAMNARMKMSEMPVDAELIDNPLTIAPGFKIENVYVLAGIPKIMQAMFESIAPQLTIGPKLHKRIVADQVLEGLVAHDLSAIQSQYPDIEIGSYPTWQQAGDKGMRIVIKGYDLAQVEDVCKLVFNMFIKHSGQPHIVTE